MNVKPTLLSKGMPRAAPAPVAQDADDEQDYEIYASEEVDEKGKSLVRSDDSRARTVCVAESQVHPLLAQLGFTATEISAILRSELLKERSGGRHEGDLADWKHYYLAAGNNSLSTTELSYPLTTIAGGTGVNQRLTNTIAIRKGRIKIHLRRNLTAAPTAQATDPTITIVIFRDKIPTTPGTMPVVHGTDANPPASATLLLSQLGSTNAAAIATAVRNPITEDAYHIYRILKVQLERNWTYISTNLAQPSVESRIIEVDIDFNMVQQKYATYAATAADINNLWLCAYANVDYTNYGFTDTIAVTSDIEFCDIQD